MSDQHQNSRQEAAEALYRVARARFGSRFLPDGEERVQNDLLDLAESIETLRAFPLTNGDEPDFAFQAKRTESSR